MKLPSGNEISKEMLVEMCEGVIGEKFMMECPFDEAFEPTAETLHEGNYTDIPALDDDDITFLYNALKDVVIEAEARLRSTLGTFMAHSIVVNSW
ncbi:hypothetical protein ES703_46270 [subsurface metagenome]